MNEYPFNVHCYQFPDLRAARAHAREMNLGFPRLQHPVTMPHPQRRGPENKAIMLDVSSVEPAAAIAAFDAANQPVFTPVASDGR